MTMQEKIADLRKRKAHLEAGGGPQRIAKHKEQGKLTARERVAHLVDADSFEEFGLYAQHRATMFGMEGNQAQVIQIGSNAVQVTLGPAEGQPFGVAGVGPVEVALQDGDVADVARCIVGDVDSEVGIEVD